jgi:quercetin dioxygenase-like cupin family protein
MENAIWQDTGRKPMVPPFNEDRKIIVLGIEVTIKTTSQESEEGIYVFEQLTPPGVGVPVHIHRREDEILHVLKGEFEVFLDGKIYNATRGFKMNFPRFIPHGFRNVGTKPARALFDVIPGANFEKFFEELSALPSDEPPDMAKVAEIFDRYGLEIVAS